MLLSVRRALDTQLDAIESVSRMLSIPPTPLMHNLTEGWRLDGHMLSHATPIAWSPEVIDAVYQASRLDMPRDTLLNKWNLGSSMAWWYFEEPLAIPTNDMSASPACPADFPDHLRYPPIRALCVGWCRERDTQERVFRVGVWTDDPLGTMDAITRLQYGFSDYRTEVSLSGQTKTEASDIGTIDLTGKLIPSQTWCWMENEALSTMMTRLDVEHDRIYKSNHMMNLCEPFPKEKFMDACEKLSRFILAGVAWFEQKIIVTQDEHVERHRRKAFNKKVKTPITTMKVVHLRRRSYPTSDSSGEPSEREYSCQWLVDKHWRNQACGPNWSDRRLVLIKPYLKGPADKPLRVPEKTVVVADR